jgi:hypothetical protein
MLIANPDIAKGGAMSQNIAQPSRTEHAWLVLLGEYARQLGLIQALNGVPLQQKVRTHRPQTKVIEYYKDGYNTSWLRMRPIFQNLRF